MTDTLLSGWGPAKNKVNKLIIECKNEQQAGTIIKNAQKREEMKDIRFETDIEKYNCPKYVNSMQKYEDLHSRWKV